MSASGPEPEPFAEISPGNEQKPVSRMGPVERIFGVFMEPGSAFQDIKIRPTWLVAFLITSLFMVLFYFAYTARVPYEIRRQAILDRQVRAAEKVTGDEFQAQKMREEFERRTPMKEALQQRLTGVGGTVVGLLGVALIVSALYLLGSMMMGKAITFKQALSVRIYSDLPPVVTSTVLLIILLFLKSPNEIDPVNPNSVLTSNLGFLVDAKQHVVLGTIANNIDIFQIWAVILAVIGLSTVAEKMTRGQAIGIVMVVWTLGLLFKMGANALSGGLGL